MGLLSIVSLESAAAVVAYWLVPFTLPVEML